MNRILRIHPWIHLAMSLGLLLGLIVNPAPAMAQGGTHVVQPGETLYSLSRRYSVSVYQIAEANGLTVNTWLYVGQQLTIPGLTPDPAPATGTTYIVRPGDTLISIAARNNISASALASANGLTLTSWVYVGQRLTLPGQPSDPPPPTPGSAYTVQRGDTLFSIARWHGTTVAALRAANNLGSNLIYVGQELTIPNGDDPVAPPVDSTPAPPSPPSQTRSGKWIDVNLSTQIVTAYEGQTSVYTALASTGTQWTPTVVGTYEIYVKYASTTMSGPGYYLPNVPYTMYFYKGYGLHGTYWHSNFGTPMSHGCVNLATPDAEWFYNWAPIGTPVVSHY